MPNKPTTLREFDKWKDETMTDFVANFGYPIISPEYISMFEQFIVGHAKRLLTSHNTELVSKIEGMKYPTIEKGGDMPSTEFTTAKPVHESNEVFVQFGFNSALDEVKSLINQEK